MRNYLIVHPYSAFSNLNVDEPFYLIDMYDLPTIDLEAFDCMIISGMVDQDFLIEEKHIIEKFLNDGKLVCYFGSLISDWLPGQQAYNIKNVKMHTDYDIYVAKEHPIYEGVKVSEMTSKMGVKGIFARGYHPAPKDAEVLLTFNNGEPITYIDRNSTNGTIFMHSGSTLFHMTGMNPEKGRTTERIPAQMLTWANEEILRLKGANKNA